MIFVVIFPAAFMLMFVSIAQPRGYSVDYYETFFWVAWAATGQGYLISVTNKPESAKFNGLLSVLMCVMFSGVEPPLSFFTGFARDILSLSFARWAVESLTILEFKQYVRWQAGAERARGRSGASARRERSEPERGDLREREREELSSGSPRLNAFETSSSASAETCTSASAKSCANVKTCARASA
jgi:hypothetical protein